jgi:hypothetical protein
LEIIALSGFARSGKDEAAKVLVNEFGFTRVAFADKLREVLYQLNPWVRSFESGFGATYERLQDVIDKQGWDGYKNYQYADSIREYLQRLGTEAGRQTLWDTIWIDAAFANLSDNSKVVVSDARFINEFNAVKSRGGEIWRIDRPGVGPANNHASEIEAKEYKDFDRHIYNAFDTVEKYHEYIKNMYSKRGRTTVSS